MPLSPMSKIKKLKSKASWLVILPLVILVLIGIENILSQRIDNLTKHYQPSSKESNQTIQSRLTESVVKPYANTDSTSPSNKDLVWCEPEKYKDLSNHSAFRNFNRWLEEWSELNCIADQNCTHDPRKRRNFISEGEKIAKARSEVLRQIIRGDPHKAIQLALTEDITSSLPLTIQDHVEKWENDIVDLDAIHVCFDSKHPKGLIRRIANFQDGRKFKTFVYGQRKNVISTKGLSLWGISLEGEMAMSDQPFQIIKDPESDNQSLVLGGKNLSFDDNVELKLFERDIKQSERKARLSRTRVSYPIIAASSSLKDYYDKKYDLIHTPMTWSEANQTAFDNNGRLVCIGSVQEKNFIYKLIKTADRGTSPEGTSVSYAWIGATDKEDQNGSIFNRDTNTSSVIEIDAIEGDWKWLNGDDVNGTYSNWLNSIEPNNTVNSEQDFAAMDWSTPEGFWKDLNVSYRLPFVIEYNVGIEPAANSVAVDGFRKVLVIPARFMDEGFTYEGSSTPLVDRQGNNLFTDAQKDSFEPVTAENLIKAMEEVKQFYLRNSDNTFHLEPVIASTVTLALPKYEKKDGDGSSNLFDTSGSYYGFEDIEHEELPDLGVAALFHAALLNSDWDFSGPAFQGVSTISLDSVLVGGGFTGAPAITFSGGNINPITNLPHPNFVSAKAEAFVNADGNITGIKILDSGAYYFDTPKLLVNGSDILSGQFNITVQNVCISWVVTTTHAPGAAGLGFVGGAGSHVDAGSGGTISSGVIAHELGHNFGLLHANRYISESEKPNSDEGQFVDYGNPYSVMGGGGIGGDITMPGKVAIKNISGFGLTIGKTAGVDVAQVSTSADLINSPLIELMDGLKIVNPNTFRIYRHDYGAAPLSLQVATFNVSIPPQELGILEQNDSLSFNVDILGTGDGAAGRLDYNSGSPTLTITEGGKGYIESPMVRVLAENNESILSLDPSWIRISAGISESIQADLRDYSEATLRGLRGVEIMSSQFAPIGGDTFLAYWLSFRRSVSEYGLSVINGTGSNQAPLVENYLLDMTPLTPGDFTDAFLLPGHTFSDYEADTHITPIGRGGVYPMEYLEVVLNMGTVGEGESKAPAFVVQTNTRTPTVGEYVEITAEVSDGNTSAYAYSWFTNERVESDITFLNKPTIYKSFDKAGQFVIRVIVSDMKGGIASRNVIFNVGEYEKSNFSSISGSVRSNNGFVQGARVVIEKAPIIEHTVSLQGNERDWFLPNGNNNPLKYNIDGTDSPKLTFYRGEVHRFRFDSSTEGFPISFLNEPEHESARVRINMLVTPMVNDRASGYIESTDANVSGGSVFSTYATHKVGTIEDFQKGRLGIVNQPIIITRPYAKVLLQDTNVTNVLVRPTLKNEEGLFVQYGGIGHDRDNPPNVTILRSSLWEDYNEPNATGRAYVDGVGTISPVSGITFLGGIWQNRANNDPIPELVVWGTGSGANATVETYNRPNNNKPHRQIIVHDQGINFEPNGTMAVLHYPLDPLMNLSFDRHESLYDESDNARFQPSPVWNALDTKKLRHYWNFDEENGTVANDQVTTGSVNLDFQTFDLSDENRSQWGTRGRAVRIESNETFGPVGGTMTSFPYTLSFWINPDADANFTGGSSAFSTFSSTQASPSKRKFSYSNASNMDRSTIRNPWAHIAFVAESATNGFLYVDGFKIPITACVEGNFWLDQFAGLLDEMYVYSKAMTETEVKRMAGRLFLDLSGNRLHAVPIGTDFNMSAPPIVGVASSGDDLGISTERPGVGSGPKSGNSNLGDTFPGENHGQSIYFDDNDSYLDLSNNITSFSGLDHGSISFWIRTPGLDENGDDTDLTVLSASDVDDNESYFRIMVRDIGVMQLHVVNDGTEVAKFYTNQASKVRYEGSPGQKDWHHVVLVVDETKSAFWVDGNQATSINYSSGSGDSRAFFSDIENMDTFTIGLHQTAEANATNSYRGWLDDFNFYDRSLTSTEISYLYNLRKGKEQLPRLEAVVDAVGTVKIIENGEGYKETPDITFSYGQEGNLTSELSVHATRALLNADAALSVHGKLAYVQDENLVYAYHHVRDDSNSSWHSSGSNNGWREYGQAFGKGELNATGVDRILWTKDSEKLSTIQLPDDRNVSRRYLEYVVDVNGDYAAPYGLNGYVAPPEITLASSSADKTASAYALFFIDQNNSAEIVNPGRGYGAIGFDSASVRVSGPGYRPQQINRIFSMDGVGQPTSIDVIASGEEEHGNQATITQGGTHLFGNQGQHVFYDWTANEQMANDEAHTDFNQSLSHISVLDSGFGYSLPVSISLVGGYPLAEELNTWVTSGNTTPFQFVPAQIEVNGVDENGTILGFNIVDPGEGYVFPPLVVITGGGGFGGSAIANITNGEITDVFLDPIVPNPGGRGYFNIDSNNTPTSRLVHVNPLTSTEQDANLSLRLGGSLKEIPTCSGCSGGGHGTHTEVWIEIWDKNRTEVKIDANGDRALAVAKVKNGAIEKVIVVNSGQGYLEPVIFVRGAGPKHMDYFNNNNYENREWRCVNFREDKLGNLVECGHLQKGLYPPEQCPGEIDEGFPITAVNSITSINSWNGRHSNLCKGGDYNATTHLVAGFKSRSCSGTKVNFVLINDVYRTPYESWMGFDANLSVLVNNGKIREILVKNNGSMYASSAVYISGSGGEVDAVPIFNDAGLNTQVIFDDPKLKNLEFELIQNPLGAGHGFQERPWSWDWKNDDLEGEPIKVYAPTFGAREKIFSTSVPSSIVAPEVAFGLPSLFDNLGDRVLEVEVREFGIFESSRNITLVAVDFNGTHRPDVDKNGSADFIEAKVLAHSTNRLTKFFFDHNGTYLDNKGTPTLLDDRYRSLFTEQPVVNIIDDLGNVNVLANNPSSFVRMNGLVDYDSISELGYIDLYIDDRFPNNFFYGFAQDTNSAPAMGGEIIVAEGLPGMNWAQNEPNEKNTTTYTDQNGFYSMPNLEPGLYNVAVFMEDENFQESTFRPDTNQSHVTEVLYVPGIPELTIETDERGSGISRLIWSSSARQLSKPNPLMSATQEFNHEQKILEGIGMGFQLGEIPQLILIPSSTNVSSAIPKLTTSTLVDGSLRIEIIDDENTTAFYPNDRFTVLYSSTISGVDFREDFLYSKSNNSSWAGTFDAGNRGVARLEIFPNDGNGTNGIEAPLSTATLGDSNFTFRARAYDENGTIISTDSVQWALELDFNSSDGNNTNIANLSSPQYYAFGDDGVRGEGYYYPVYLSPNGLGATHQHIINGITVYMETSNVNHAEASLPLNSGLVPLPLGYGTTSEINLTLHSSLRRGSVKQVLVSSSGSNYQNDSEVIMLGGGNDFSGKLIVDGLGKILDINITNSGIGYDSRSQLQIIDTNGSGAQLTPILGGGSLSVIASMPHGGNTLTSRVQVIASKRTPLSPKEIWLGRYTDSFVDRDTTWWTSDLDGDGLSNYHEWEFSTNPDSNDTDGDGLSDSAEEGNRTNPNQKDTDSDGLTDYLELTDHMTNPLLFDSDQDGWSDGYEVSMSFDPLVQDTENTGYLSGIFLNTTPLESNVSSYLEFNNSQGTFYQKVNLGPTSIYPQYFYQNTLPQNQIYTVVAFIDRNGDGVYSAGEPVGQWEGNLTTSTGLVKIQVLDPRPTIQFIDGVDQNESQNPGPESIFASAVAAFDSFEGVLPQANITREGNGTGIIDLNESSGLASVKEGAAPGDYVLNYYAVDGLGTQSEVLTQNIKILDILNPALLLLQDNILNLEAGATYTEPGFYAFDNVDGDITNKVVYSNQFISHIPGINFISYSVTDTAGNSNSTTRSITVVDTTAPVLLLNGSSSITLEAGGLFLDPNATWSDIVDGNGMVTARETLDTFVVGSHILTYDYNDTSNNLSNQVTRYVSIIDTTPASTSIIGQAEVQHEAGGTFNDPGVSWVDIVDGNGTIQGAGNLDPNIPGSYELTYIYTDESNNSSDPIIRKVHVVDVTPPQLQLIGDQNVSSEAGFDYQDQGATWIDAVDGNGTVSSVGSVNVQFPGIYTHNYFYTDQAGNVGLPFPLTRLVTVEDTKSPTFVFPQQGLSPFFLGQEIVFPEVIAIDLFDGNLTSEIQISYPPGFDENKTGSYLLTFSVSDSSGNLNSIEKRIQILDTVTYSLVSAQKFSEDGWLSSNWLGSFYPTGGSWIFHVKLGWLNLQAGGTSGYWFWDPTLGIWWWTSIDTFPFIYLSEDKGWQYLDLQNNPVRVYNYQTSTWSLR